MVTVKKRCDLSVVKRTVKCSPLNVITGRPVCGKRKETRRPPKTEGVPPFRLDRQEEAAETSNRGGDEGRRVIHEIVS